MKKLVFSDKSSIPLLFESRERRIVNFLNMHDIYQFSNEPLFREAVSGAQNISYLDGFLPKLALSIIKLRRIRRMRGPTFTKELFMKAAYSKNKKMMFIGIETADLNKLAWTFSNLRKENLKAHNPPYISGLNFPEKEVGKMAALIKKFKPQYVFICVGSPKQNILANQLFKRTNAKLFFNVGAALDFLLGKKKEAPKLVQSLGLEWLYRGLTDFKYSKKKIWRSLVALKYLKNISMKS